MNRLTSWIRSRVLRFVLVVVAVSVLVLGTGMIGAGGYRHWHYMQWYAERDRVWEIIDSWEQDARPDGVTVNAWQEFIATFHNVVGNGIWPNDTSLAQLRHIRAEFEAADKESITADTFDELYERVYEHVGPKGQRWLGKGSSLHNIYTDSRKWIRPVQPAVP